MGFPDMILKPDSNHLFYEYILNNKSIIGQNSSAKSWILTCILEIFTLSPPPKKA